MRSFSFYLVSAVVLCSLITEVWIYSYLFPAHTAGHRCRYNTNLKATDNIPIYNPETKKFSLISRPKSQPAASGHVFEEVEVVKLSKLIKQYQKQEKSNKKAKEERIDESDIPLSKLLASLLQKRAFMHIEDDVSDTSTIPDTLYITEVELREIWDDASKTSFGKPLDKFNEQEALLLVDDVEDLDLFQMGEEDESVEEEGDMYITMQELERIWHKRQEITAWGISRSFNLEEALLLASEENEDDDQELMHALAQAAQEGCTDPFNSNFVLDREIPKATVDPEIQKLLDAINEQLDGPGKAIEEGWKKSRTLFTPDVDTQRYFGDIMMSNTYLTPALLDGDDEDEDVFGSTELPGSKYMTYPGEPIVDFNDKPHLWDRYGFNVTRESIMHEDSAIRKYFRNYLKKSDLSEEEQEAKLNLAFQRLQEKIEKEDDDKRFMDELLEIEAQWESERREKREMELWGGIDDMGFEVEVGDVNVDEDEDDGDFEEEVEEDEFDFADGESSAENEEEDFFRDPKAEVVEKKEETRIETREEKLERLKGLKRARVLVSIIKFIDEDHERASQLQAEEKAILADREMLRKDHLIVSALPKPDEETTFDFDEDMTTSKDFMFGETILHLKCITGMCFRNHKKISDEMDMFQAWDRFATHLFRNATYVGNELVSNVQFPVKEEIPAYLTPDKNRGIEYTDEIFELKNKKVLGPKFPEPEVLYANDSFGYNEDVRAISMVGTVREQYDWTPRTDLVHEIEWHKLAQLEPLLEFVNGCAELQSTKDNIIIFKYKGRMRHIVGIQASMTEIAKKCMPDLKEFRLECSRYSDPLDY